MDTQREMELKDQATVSGQPLQQLFHSGAGWTLMADSSTCAMEITCKIEGTHAIERCVELKLLEQLKHHKQLKLLRHSS